MDALSIVELLQKPTAPRFPNADAVDRYYRAHDPGNLGRFLVPFVSTAAVISVLVFVLEMRGVEKPEIASLSQTGEIVERAAGH